MIRDTVDFIWKPIESAPYQRVIWVRNKLMEKPVKATRGYADENRMVHPDTTYCTSVHTPETGGLGFPAGMLVCPDEWKPVTNEE